MRFVDVVGFSTLPEPLKLESIYPFTDECVEILARQVQHDPEAINQVTDNGVMALCGAPMACDDRAVQAHHGTVQRLWGVPWHLRFD